MENWKIVTLLLLVPKIFFGQTVTPKFTNYGKLHICNYERFEKAEANKKAALIGEMALEYLIADHEDTSKICHIVLEFHHDFQNLEKPYVYAAFDTLNVPGVLVNGKHTNGLRLTFKSSEHSAALVLKLLAYCLHEVKANNFKQTKKFEHEIDYLTHYSNPQVDQILQNAHLRPSKPWMTETVYAYQNDKYLFFHPSENNLTEFDRMDHILKNTFLTLTNVKEILGNTKTGSLIFITDSSFYYLPKDTKQFKDKIFTISEVFPHREPCKRIVFEKDSLFKIFLYFANNNGLEQKTLFLPTMEKLIPNYQISENAFIQNTISGKKEKSNLSTIIIITTVLSSLLIVAFVVMQYLKSE